MERATAPIPARLTVPDSTRYDLELPQRVTAEALAEVEVPFYDLRPVLREMDECPYFPRHLHWTTEGRQRVAEYSRAVVLGAVMT
jgi:hypothetical protein